MTTAKILPLRAPQKFRAPLQYLFVFMLGGFLLSGAWSYWFSKVVLRPAEQVDAQLKIELVSVRIDLMLIDNIAAAYAAHGEAAFRPAANMPATASLFEYLNPVGDFWNIGRAMTGILDFTETEPAAKIEASPSYRFTSDHQIALTLHRLSPSVCRDVSAGLSPLLYQTRPITLTYGAGEPIAPNFSMADISARCSSPETDLTITIGLPLGSH